MKYEIIDSPGTICLNNVLFNTIKRNRNIKTFIEIGPGEGKLANKLCSLGYKGIGVDFSDEVIESLSSNMSKYIKEGRYKIINKDFIKEDIGIKADLTFSIMVMEHIEDDLKFLKRMKNITNKNGIVLIGVPGRKKNWGIEDEVSGHYRRYDRKDLLELFDKSGFKEFNVNSVGVPISNILFKLGENIINNSHAAEKRDLSLEEQTKLSGFKDIKYKTLFPFWFKYIFNNVTLSPFLLIQKLFFNTNLGLTIIAYGYNE